MIVTPYNIRSTAVQMRPACRRLAVSKPRFNNKFFKNKDLVVRTGVQRPAPD